MNKSLAAVLCVLAGLASFLSSSAVLAANPVFAIASLPDSTVVTQGTVSSSTFTISTSEIVGSALPTYPIVLDTSGLPAGATASFSALSITNAGSATLTVTTDATTPAGTYSFQALGGTVDLLSLAETPLTLTVLPAPDFGMATVQSAPSVVAGGTVSLAISDTAINGFSGATNLALSGLPTGAAASFSPAIITGSGSATLTLTTTAATPAGIYSLIITGTSGALVHSLPLQLTVTVPVGLYSIAATPAAQTVVQGSSANYAVSTTVPTGVGQVSNALAVAGLPGGTTASFAPPSTTGNGSSILTVTTSSATPAGTYALTVSSALAPAVVVQLTVVNANSAGGDVPLPPWAYVLLSLGLLGAMWRQRRAV
jgi:hypothetical protein